MAAPLRIAAGTGRATTLGAGQRLVIRKPHPLNFLQHMRYPEGRVEIEVG